MIKTTLITTALLAAAATLPASAAPALHAPSAAKGASNSTVLVQQFKYRQGRAWRNRDGRGHWRHRHRHHNDGIGVGGLVLGGITAAIIADAITDGRATDDARRACADRYRSFDWDSGTYTGYDGNTYVCPYLR